MGSDINQKRGEKESSSLSTMTEAPSSTQHTPQPTSEPHGQSQSPSQVPKGNERPRLTESEKKTNHIASEQKRRMAIREGFDRLTEIVPGLEGMGRSESVVLQKSELSLCVW
jgi:heteromeric Ino2p/Ino4p transcription factor